MSGRVSSQKGKTYSLLANGAVGVIEMLGSKYNFPFLISSYFFLNSLVSIKYRPILQPTITIVPI